MYIHELPTTGAISFADYITTNTFLSELATATQLRASLRLALKQYRHADGDDEEKRDCLVILKAIDNYLPYLYSIVNCWQTDDVIVTKEPVFSWRSALSSTVLSSSPRISIAGFYYELVTVLLLRSNVLANIAVATMSSLGDYELDRHLTTAERKANDEQLKTAADMLCQSAGIREYLSEQLIPQWEKQAGHIDGRPPEATCEVTLALSKLALADAQLLAIRRLLSPSLSDASDFSTPGPPLPKSHPSASLLAKLYLHVDELYSSALALCEMSGKKSSGGASKRGAAGPSAAKLASASPAAPRTGSEEEQALRSRSRVFDRLRRPGNSSASGTSGGSSTSSSAEDGERVSGAILRYLAHGSAAARARAFKWLAIDKGESGGSYGDALGLLELARSALADTEDGPSSGMRALKDRADAAQKRNRAGLKSRWKAEMASVRHWTEAYRKLNDTVAFQPIPASSTLRAALPSGRAALPLRPYAPPEALFGPGARGSLALSDRLAHLALNGEGEGKGVKGVQDDADSSDDETDEHGQGDSEGLPRALGLGGAKTRPVAEYAGAGAYY